MLATDRSILILLGSVIGLSLGELGVGAYLAYLTSYRAFVDYDANSLYGYNVSYGHGGTVFPQVGYVLFCSIWSLLVAGLILAAPRIFKQNGRLTDQTLGITTLVIYTLTTIFWLSGFGSLAALTGGFAVGGVFGAVLAFAVLLWLIFLALTVLTFLTGFGVVKSERRGHHAMFKSKQEATHPEFNQMNSASQMNYGNPMTSVQVDKA